jgi:hypothetical protein
MQKPTNKLKHINAVGNPKKQGKIYSPPTAMQRHDSTCAKQGYGHGIQDRISREFFNTYNHARVVVENHRQG